MAIADRQKPKGFRLCPFWQSTSVNTSSSSSSTQNLHTSNAYHDRDPGQAAGRRPADGGSRARPAGGGGVGVGSGSSSGTVSSVARSLLPARRRLRLDPANSLYFPYEPGKQFQTTAPKSCYMRPPGGTLAPGESIIATVFKFVEQPENNEKQVDQKSKVKFKIMSLKVKAGIDYVPELFDEQKDQVTVERILRVVFLDVERPSPAMEKLKRQLAEAEAALETRKKPPLVETGAQVVGDGLVIDEWKERREKYLARQQVEAVGTA